LECHLGRRFEGSFDETAVGYFEKTVKKEIAAGGVVGTAVDAGDADGDT